MAVRKVLCLHTLFQGSSGHGPLHRLEFAPWTSCSHSEITGIFIGVKMESSHGGSSKSLCPALQGAEPREQMSRALRSLVELGDAEDPRTICHPHGALGVHGEQPPHPLPDLPDSWICIWACKDEVSPGAATGWK